MTALEVEVPAVKGMHASFASDRLPGELVGPYRLSRLLGEGGMAEVWLAQRADGSIKREVALKLPMLRRGRDDLSSRFARERDILAALEHPHIARLYDAGVSHDGLPYLAMEYVRGERLTVWCDSHRLGVNERVRLVLQVLEALQYAHAHHVIHRDIKPSNILVNEAGHVRLLDFGVAKLLEQHEQQTDLTIAYGRALTPDYASPELARGDTAEPASDVYSLGVLLYELLTGSLPYGIEAPYSAASLERAILAAEVERPSEHLAPDADAARSTTPTRLKRQLRGDLDAIVLKTLAKEPADRYGSAAALADDVQRHLNGQPVKARPDRFAYRFTRLAQRRRPGWTAVIATAGLAVAALAYTTIRPPRPALIEVSAAASPASAVAVVAQQYRTIAVLPFVDMSEKKDQEYFSDGLSEELINHLSQSPGLKVIARTSSFQFKGKNEDVRAIAGKLGVANLLEGSVRRSGQALRVTTQLIRASDGVQVWSQTFDRNLVDIFQVQDEISERVAKALNTTLAIASQPSRRKSDVEAYNLVLEGNYYKGRRTLGDVKKAAQLYRRAIDINPDYALAWARLGSAYLIAEVLQGPPGPPTMGQNKQVLEALDRAIRLDPNLAWAYYTRAGFEMNVTWDWAAAKADDEHVREIDPQFELLPSAFGDLALAFGEVNRAVEFYEDDLSRNPLDPNALDTLSNALCAANRLQECLQTRLNLLQLHPEFDGANRSVALARLSLGQFAAALDMMQEEQNEHYRLGGLALVYWAMGRRSESDAALHALTERFGSIDSYGIATVHAYRGEIDDAFRWLNRAYRERSYGMLGLKTDPLLLNLHDDPRFQELLRHMRLPDPPTLPFRS